VFAPLGLSDSAGSSDVSWFSQPYGAAILILALLCYAPQRLSIIPLVLNFFILLGVQVRAEWLSFAVAFSLWSILSKRYRQLVQVVAAMAALLVIGLVSDFRLPAPETRGGEVSVRFIVGRSLTAISPELARGLIDNPERYASTVSWRTGWWKSILRESHKDMPTAILGLGYGYPIWDHHPEGLAYELRTPHSIVVWVLGYTGWLGLAIYLGMHASLGIAMWRVYRSSGQIFGLLVWVLYGIWSTADNLLEAPYGAIPFFLLLGLSAAGLLNARPHLTGGQSASTGHSAETQP
jgi:hypothetical protein